MSRSWWWFRESITLYQVLISIVDISRCELFILRFKIIIKMLDVLNQPMYFRNNRNNSLVYFCLPSSGLPLVSRRWQFHTWWWQSVSRYRGHIHVSSALPLPILGTEYHLRLLTNGDMETGKPATLHRHVVVETLLVWFCCLFSRRRHDNSFHFESVCISLILFLLLCVNRAIAVTWKISCPWYFQTICACVCGVCVCTEEGGNVWI